jgi:hypothetical protein
MCWLVLASSSGAVCRSATQVAQVEVLMLLVARMLPQAVLALPLAAAVLLAVGAGSVSVVMARLFDLALAVERL